MTTSGSAKAVYDHAAPPVQHATSTWQVVNHQPISRESCFNVASRVMVDLFPAVDNPPFQSILSPSQNREGAALVMSARVAALERDQQANGAPETSRGLWGVVSGLQAPNGELQGPSGAEMAAEDARDFAQSHFRRRNRLESRLEELQKDVAKLTMKLRSGSTRSAVASSVGDVSIDRTPEAARVLETREKNLTPTSAAKKAVKKTPEPRWKTNGSEVVTPTGRINHAQSNSVRTLRELHRVTTERDQLRFELEKTKRALATIEKKYSDAKRVKQAYEKLKAHCDSLQESLELSEKIRARQKKLLQQLQRQAEISATQQATLPTRATRLGTTRASNATTAALRPKKAPIDSYRNTGVAHRRQRGEHDGEIFHDLTPRHERQDDYDFEDYVASPSVREPAEGGFESRAKNPSRPSTPHRTYRSEFDDLLKTERPLQSQYTVQRPRQISTRQKVQEQNTSISKPYSARSTATQQAAGTRTKKRTPVNRPKNSFLAPTQASLNRMHQVTGRYGDQRRPFIP